MGQAQLVFLLLLLALKHDSELAGLVLAVRSMALFDVPVLLVWSAAFARIAE